MRLLEIREVQEVDDLHVWALAGGKNCISAHLKLMDNLSIGNLSSESGKGVARRVHQQAMDIIQDYAIYHSTLQIL